MEDVSHLADWSHPTLKKCQSPARVELRPERSFPGSVPHPASSSHPPNTKLWRRCDHTQNYSDHAGKQCVLRRASRSIIQFLLENVVPLTCDSRMSALAKSRMRIEKYRISFCFKWYLLLKLLSRVKLWDQTAEPQFWISERTYSKRLAVYLETNLPTSPHASRYCQIPPTVRSYRRLISHSEGCASDPPIITHGHAFQIPNLDLKHMSARFSIATAQIPDPPGIVSGLHAFRPDAHDRYMSLGQILYIHSLAQSPTPKHCWLVISGNPTRQAIRMCQGLCIEFL